MRELKERLNAFDHVWLFLTGLLFSLRTPLRGLWYSKAGATPQSTPGFIPKKAYYSQASRTRQSAPFLRKK